MYAKKNNQFLICILSVKKNIQYLVFKINDFLKVSKDNTFLYTESILTR